MRYPKENIAIENEHALMRWLKQNDSKLPLSLYQLAKELGWSFGAIRGTVNRLESQPQNMVLKVDMIEPESKRFKTKIALKGRPSEQKLLGEIDFLKKNYQDRNFSTPPTESNSINIPISKILEFLRLLSKIDEKVPMIASEIKDLNLLQKFIDFQFGLEAKEKKELNDLIHTLEGN